MIRTLFSLAHARSIAPRFIWGHMGDRRVTHFRGMGNWPSIAVYDPPPYIPISTFTFSPTTVLPNQFSKLVEMTSNQSLEIIFPKGSIKDREAWLVDFLKMLSTKKYEITVNPETTNTKKFGLTGANYEQIAKKICTMNSIDRVKIT